MGIKFSTRTGNSLIPNIPSIILIIIVAAIIVYLYFDMYKSCIPITSITSEIGT